MITQVITQSGVCIPTRSKPKHLSIFEVKPQNPQKPATRGTGMNMSRAVVSRAQPVCTIERTSDIPTTSVPLTRHDAWGSSPSRKECYIMLHPTKKNLAHHAKASRVPQIGWFPAGVARISSHHDPLQLRGMGNIVFKSQSPQVTNNHLRPREGCSQFSAGSGWFRYKRLKLSRLLRVKLDVESENTQK